MEALHGEVGTKKTFATPWLVWNLSRRTAKSAWRPGPDGACHLGRLGRLRAVRACVV